MRSNETTRGTDRHRKAMRRATAPLRCASRLALFFLCGTAGAQPVVFLDVDGDSVVRRTDPGADGPYDPASQAPINLLETRLGAYSPSEPSNDLFVGAWDGGGDFVRLDMVLQGRVNPPGLVAYDDTFPTYDPFLYGPNPMFGWIELDLDANVDTGGELDNPELRYLGNVARFGGLPPVPDLANRSALNAGAFDHNVTTAPLVDRSGEEFHLAMFGEEIETIEVISEKLGGNPLVFEDGEVWQLEGDFLHRAHGFEDFAFLCVNRPGRYKPDVWLQFAHDEATDTTVVSLVYPLTNAAFAATQSPPETPEPIDGCDNNHNSVEEALFDLQFSAQFADPFTQSLPEFQLIAGWAYEDPAQHLDPAGWRIFGLVGTAYGIPESGGERHIWTDVWPSPRVGDFDGDGSVSAADVLLLTDFITAQDGNPAFDVDGNPSNGSLTLPGFGPNFCLYDSNYDGLVNNMDAVVPGDMNLDQVFDVLDVDDFVQALLDPGVYVDTHFGTDPQPRGDLNFDGALNAGDTAEFLEALLLP